MKMKIKIVTRFPDLMANKIWEVLFRETEAWKWKTLQYFLCDLKSFETLISEDSNIFYWVASGDNGWTETSRTFEKWLIESHIYKIEIYDKEIEITKL